MHCRKSGVTDHYATDDLHALVIARRIMAHQNLNLLKRPNCHVTQSVPPLFDPSELRGIIPSDTRVPYDVRKIIARVVDGSRYRELETGRGIRIRDGNLGTG